MIPLERAFRISGQNGASRWPKRSQKNRLEPECWPAISPKFQLEAGARVFTIGSCFARHIEFHLDRLGFDVPSLRFRRENEAYFGDTGGDVINKYTPPSILQELTWTKAIFDRDDTVRSEDIELFLLPLADGKLIDMQRAFLGRYGVTERQALDTRRKFYSLFRQAFLSDATIITLGLIECWWDRRNTQYIEMNHAIQTHSEADRFFFKRLSFEEAYQYTADAVDLLDPERRKPVLITTSPVPIARTFTPDDVIVANTYSKSLLRTVAGRIAEERGNVDYFPSYESVMLTNQSSIWMDDLIHVDPNFVGRIMLRVTECYLGRARSGDHDLYDCAQQVVTLVTRRRYSEAKALCDRAKPGFCELELYDLQAALAETAAVLGDVETARKHADIGVRLSRDLAEGVGIGALLQCARAFDVAGDRSGAEAARRVAIDALRGCPHRVRIKISGEANCGHVHDAIALMRFVEEEMQEDLETYEFIAKIYERMERWADVERVLHKGAYKTHPFPELIAEYAIFLASKERRHEAIAELERALVLAPGNILAMRRLAGEYMKANMPENVGRMADRLIESEPRKAAGHFWKAWSLARAKSKRRSRSREKR